MTFKYNNKMYISTNTNTDFSITAISTCVCFKPIENNEVHVWTCYKCLNKFHKKCTKNTNLKSECLTCITIKQSPFQKLNKSLLPVYNFFLPFEIKENNNKLIKFPIQFEFSEENFLFLQTVNQSQERLKVYIYSYRMGYDDKCIEWPKNVKLVINGRNLDAMKEFGKALEITKYLGRKNQIDFNYSKLNSDGYLILILPVETLSIDEVKLEKTYTVIKCKKKIIKLMTNSLIKEEQISIYCPLSSSVMKCPVRSKRCSHLQCFDFISFLKCRFKSYKCPICRNSIYVSDLYEDTYYKFIIGEFMEQFKDNFHKMTVFIDNEANWRVVDKDKVKEMVRDRSIIKNSSRLEIKFNQNNGKNFKNGLDSLNSLNTINSNKNSNNKNNISNQNDDYSRNYHLLTGNQNINIDLLKMEVDEEEEEGEVTNDNSYISYINNGFTTHANEIPETAEEMQNKLYLELTNLIKVNHKDFPNMFFQSHAQKIIAKLNYFTLSIFINKSNLLCRQDQIFPNDIHKYENTSFYKNCEQIYNKYNIFFKTIASWSKKETDLVELIVRINKSENDADADVGIDHDVYFTIEVLIAVAYFLYQPNMLTTSLEYTLANIFSIYFHLSNFNENQIAHITDLLTNFFPCFNIPTKHLVEKEKTIYFEKMIRFYSGLLKSFTPENVAKFFKLFFEPITKEIETMEEVERLFIEDIEEIFFYPLLTRFNYSIKDKASYMRIYDTYGHFRQFLHLKNKLRLYGWKKKSESNNDKVRVGNILAIAQQFEELKIDEERKKNSHIPNNIVSLVYNNNNK